MVNKFNLRSWRLKGVKKANVKTLGKKPTAPKKSVYKRTQLKIVKTKAKRKKSVLKRKRSVEGNYAIVALPKKKIPPTQSQDSKWVIYSLKGCQHCLKAKEYLEKRNITFDYIEFESLAEAKQKSILEDIDKVKPGFRTFPRIFNPTKFIGGYSDLEKSLI